VVYPWMDTQELLAPAIVVFLDSRWNHIGAKLDMAADIVSATGISIQHLNQPKQANLAIKMSWAAKRKTSRIEDVAYCLLGIFDVNMPLLYGEGKKAFLRLELKIIKRSDDESIFAWTTNATQSGMLALWPSAFADSSDIELHAGKLKRRQPYQMTNKGLEFQIAPTTWRTDFSSMSYGVNGEIMDITLNCWRKSPIGLGAITIKVKKVGHVWYKIDSHKLALSKSVKTYKSTQPTLTPTIYIHQDGM
jgi:hypothetical protein